MTPSNSKQKISITIDSQLLQAIDKLTDNRSAAKYLEKIVYSHCERNEMEQSNPRRLKIASFRFAPLAMTLCN